MAAKRIVVQSRADALEPTPKRHRSMPLSTQTEREICFSASLNSRCGLQPVHHMVTLPPMLPESAIDDDHLILKWLESVSRTQERVATKLLVPLLSVDRAHRAGGWEVWAKVGFVISKIFRKDDEGRELFHAFSSHVQNYNETETNHIYDTSDGRVKFGSLVTWAMEDDHAGAMAVLRHEVWASTPDIGGRIDEDVVHDMVDGFNRDWLPEFDALNRGEKTPPGYHTAYATLTKNIVLYMNHWIYQIRRPKGKPKVVEEYKNEEDGLTCAVVRSQAHAKAAYLKHSLIIAGAKRRQTPMTIWLTSRDSRFSTEPIKEHATGFQICTD
jgi:hypothetical protein